jgi:hypothetical protein
MTRPTPAKTAIERTTLPDGSHAYNVYVFDGPKHWGIFYATDEKHAKRLESELKACTGWTIE